MSIGTSRNLIRYLEQEFSKEEAATHITNTALLNSINEYITKHSTYESNDNTKLSDELYSIYNSYIVNDYRKENMFLEILTLLIPCVVDKNEFLMWTKKYLKPTIDSAGLNISFVQLATRLLEKVLIDLLPTEDPKLQENRKEHSILVLRLLIDRYLTKVEIEEVNEDYPTDDRSTKNLSYNAYEIEERNRFKNLSVRNLISKFAMKDTETFLQVFDEYFVKNASHRLRLLTLLSNTLKLQPIKLYCITNTTLFETLLNAQLYEQDLLILNSTNNILCMILPHICNQLREHLPLLFAIYARLLGWDSGSKKSISSLETVASDLPNNEVDQEGLKMSEKEDTASSSSTTVQSDEDLLLFQTNNTKIESLKLATCLYAFYPLNLINFSKNAPQYLEKQSLLKHVTNFDVSRFTQISKEHILCFKVHPNYFIFQSAEAELEDVERFKDYGSPDDIAIFCLSLNTDNANRLANTFENMSGDRNGAASSNIPTSLSANLMISRASSRPNFRSLDYGSKILTKSEAEASPVSKNTIDNTLVLTADPLKVDDMLEVHKLLFQKKNSNTEAYTDLTRRHSIQVPDLSLRMEQSNEQPSRYGSSLEYYQRELMILSNELDFAEYVRNITIYRYRKCKEEKAELQFKLKESDNLRNEVELLKMTISSMHQAIPSQIESVSQLATNDLLDSNVRISFENKELNRVIGELKEVVTELKDIIAGYDLKTNPQELELRQLHNKSELMERDYKELFSKYSRSVQELKDIDTQKQSDFSKYKSSIASKLEKENYNLRQENLMLEQKLQTNSEKLIKDYERSIEELSSEITRLKLFNKQDNLETISSYMANQNKKLESLQNVIADLQYEMEEKEQRLIQIGVTKPIDIPTSNRDQANISTGKSLLGFTYESSNDLFGMKYSKENSVRNFNRPDGSMGPQMPSFGPSSYSAQHSYQERPSNGIHAHPSAARSDLLYDINSKQDHVATPPAILNPSGFNIRKHSDPTISSSKIAVKGRGGIQKKSKLRM
ncbi:hypothetical protein CANARDRAFT_26622 [[Candida] arabinofermentans NRRL YB-2248]|uniref:Uncharacterized protein n=1 Tax=[Candida] arabinofermentans NRRL YB-2248 TaxID=983967 RepID=A0A1E4T604_9ASCO|nr:hypothetical protein CANARDRAFT_26622 [[Candida] arabinofermentans NRRL YB-2248]